VYAVPVSLYIITQPNDKARLRPLVRIVVNMIVQLLADKMEFENGRPKPTYKHKLLGMIDEFPVLGKSKILQESLAFLAGYGIKCYLISQT
jgi:type IV secretion system protein VirD4